MKKGLLFIASAMIALSASATSATTAKDGVKKALSHELFRFAPKAKAEMREFGSPLSINASAPSRAKAGMQVKAAKQEFEFTQLPPADEQGFLDGPKDETWYYTMDYKKETIDHGAWKETLISGYKITVYDAAFNQVGTVEDDITLAENEVKVAQIEVGTLVTQKFFNFDNNYEIMVGIACNTTEYVNNYYTKAYSIGKNESIASFDGYYVSAVNTATDAWSEKFWITFQTEETTETPEINGIMNVADYVFKTYKSAGYSGMEDPKLTVRIPSITLAGENAIPFISTAHNGQPYFATNRMKYCWYEDPYDYSNDNPTANNELVCDIYSTPSSWSNDVELYSTTTIPSTATADNCYFMYLGAFSYNDDLSFGRYNNVEDPSLIITHENFIPSHDEYTYDFYVVSTAAKGTTSEAVKTFDLATNVLGGYFMSDITGEAPMAMFAKSGTDGNYTFDFTNLVNGAVEYSLPYNLGNGVYLTTETDRVATAGGYLLVCPQTYGGSDDEGNMHTFVAYVNTNGEVDHIDDLNLGNDIDLAQIYSNVDAFNPYIFNIDDAREYLVLVKRCDVPGQTGNHEELLVVSSDPAKGVLLQLTPDEALGSLRHISLVNIGTDNQVMSVMYYNDETGAMTNNNYSLPLSLYDEGDGTVDNPYVITTFGGLQQMKKNPAANYVLGADIDAAGNEINNSSFVFSGSFDGMGHTISNLNIASRALFPMLTGSPEKEEGSVEATVKNINFINPVLTADTDGQGLVVGNATSATISNIHVYDGKVSGTGAVAGIVGKAALYTSISECSFAGEVVSTEDATAGIVGQLMTSSTVNACAFAGTIEGESTIGGIVSSTGSNAGTIINCHVNADIKGKNTIGGIAGESMRALIANCHVEGTIEATEAPRWGGGPKAGGIVGELYPAMSESEGVDDTEGGEGTTETTAVIKGCYVNLTSLTFSGEKGEETFPGQNDTMHRIVGKSAVNNEPEIIDYDEENDWAPIYSDPLAPEAALADNYAVAALEKVAEGIADDATTTEGKSIEADETGMTFFMETLGWAYGYDAENPWSMTGDQTRPGLYFEGGLLVATPAEITAEVGEEFTIALSLKGGQITDDMFESLTFDMTNEDMFDWDALWTDVDEEGNILFYFTPVAVGNNTITFGLAGKTVTVNVTVVPTSSVGKVEAGKKNICISGRNVTAEGCKIDVYSSVGSHIVSGNGSVQLNGVPAGIYVVKATAADGKVSTAKTVIR